MVTPVLDMSNEEFEAYLLKKYGKSFHVTALTDEEFQRMAKSIDPSTVSIMRALRSN